MVNQRIFVFEKLNLTSPIDRTLFESTLFLISFEYDQLALERWEFTFHFLFSIVLPPVQVAETLTAGFGLSQSQSQASIACPLLLPHWALARSECGRAFAFPMAGLATDRHHSNAPPPLLCSLARRPALLNLLLRLCTVAQGGRSKRSL